MREIMAETSPEMFYSQLGKISQKVVRFGVSIDPGDSLWLRRLCSFSRLLNAQDDVALCSCITVGVCVCERLHLSS